DLTNYRIHPTDKSFNVYHFTKPEQADVVLNRIRACVPAGQTCSIGYTSCPPAESLSDAVIRADKALYQAKALGKNQLFVL
ncbi:MAG: hypothetical protein ACPHCN_06065, partial [Mycobacterium sp.]